MSFLSVLRSYITDFDFLPSSVNTAGRRGVLFCHLPVHIHIFTLTVFMAQDVKQLPFVLVVWGCFTCQTYCIANCITDCITNCITIVLHPLYYHSHPWLSMVQLFNFHFYQVAPLLTASDARGCRGIRVQMEESAENSEPAGILDQKWPRAHH